MCKKYLHSISYDFVISDAILSFHTVIGKVIKY